jgi:uncharacterized protein
MNSIPNRCRQILQEHYGNKLAGLIVYGSTAKGVAHPESDIDFLVLLQAPFDHFKELRVIVELLYPIQLESNQLISAKPAAVDEFNSGCLQLYRNAKHEGIRL